MKCVVITGSRNWSDEEAILQMFLREGKVDLVIHGDAKGADRISGELAASMVGTQILRMPAQWNDNGRAAGPMRNSQILIVACALRKCGWEVICEAFPDEKSVGTIDMMEKMKLAEFEVTNNGYQG